MPHIETLYYHRPDGIDFGITVPHGYKPTRWEVNKLYSSLQVQRAIHTASLPTPPPDLSTECHTVIILLMCIASILFWYPAYRKRRNHSGARVNAIHRASRSQHSQQKATRSLATQAVARHSDKL